ncbi:MAG: hypothetical protein E3J94_03655 [Desulfobacteraceae bacterium]|nr:MAG: hypothetical protein E3J94_03655 [Desulfobacteraceae bacterium]
MIAGGIIMWSGAIVDIPSGYVLCNGANGTPDLRDRFVVGSGTTYNPDDNGGSITHTHTLAGGAQVDGGVVLASTTPAANHLPPYYSLAYIMKT